MTTDESAPPAVERPEAEGAPADEVTPYVMATARQTQFSAEYRIKVERDHGPLLDVNCNVCHQPCYVATEDNKAAAEHGKTRGGIAYVCLDCARQVADLWDAYFQYQTVKRLLPYVENLLSDLIKPDDADDKLN